MKMRDRESETRREEEWTVVIMILLLPGAVAHS